MFWIAILLFMVLAFYPYAYPTVIEGIGPVPLQMTQKQAGGPKAAYAAQQEADKQQNQNNTLAGGR